MAVILRVIGGLLIVAFGVSLVIKTEFYLQQVGKIAWAEEHLGLEGGTRLFLKLLGIAGCILGIMVALNLFKGFFLATVGQFLLPSEVRDKMQPQ